MHHKRRRPKNRRAGCLSCKPHKMNGLSDVGKSRPSVRRKLLGLQADLKNSPQD